MYVLNEDFSEISFTIFRRVVTGIRFKKHNRILHLQIQQGKLLPYGRIDASTVRWEPVDDFKITDVANRRITEGTDFITLKYESRNMALDDISVDEGEDNNRVVTGKQVLG